MLLGTPLEASRILSAHKGSEAELLELEMRHLRATVEMLELRAEMDRFDLNSRRRMEREFREKQKEQEGVDKHLASEHAEDALIYASAARLGGRQEPGSAPVNPGPIREPGTVIPLDGEWGSFIEHSPLEVKPRWVDDGRRSAELIGGLARYVDSGLFMPNHSRSLENLRAASEWVSELGEIIRRHTYAAERRAEAIKRGEDPDKA